MRSEENVTGCLLKKTSPEINKVSYELLTGNVTFTLLELKIDFVSMSGV